MATDSNSEHRALGWSAIGTALIAVGALLATISATSHLLGRDAVLAGFAVACLFAVAGVYVLLAEFIGGIGPIRLRLPLTRHEKEDRQTEAKRASEAARSRHHDQPAQRSPLELWLEGRVNAHATIARERTVRTEREYQEQMGAWDTRNATELGGINTKTLRSDPSAAVAPHLLESYRADPRNPGSTDGIEPPYSPEIWDAYYERRLDWLKATLARLRQPDETTPPRPAAEPSAKEPVSAEHRDMLKAVANHLLSCIRASQKAFYGSRGGEMKACAFQEHFPEVRRQIDVWNDHVDAVETSSDALRSWVAGRLHALHYDRPSFSGGLDLPIAEAALADVPRLVFTEVLGCLHLSEVYPVVVLPSMKTLDSGWEQIPDVDRGRVERQLQEIAVEGAGRPERQRTRTATSSLTKLADPIIADLTLIAEKDVIRGLGDCELCR